jgi:hypothetical protein
MCEEVVVGFQDGGAGIERRATIRGKRVWLGKKIGPLKYSCKYEVIKISEPYHDPHSGNRSHIGKWRWR